MSGSNKVIKYANPPKVCDKCKQPFKTFMYDAKTVYGPWGNFCDDCFNTICMGLGTGLGQQYKQNDAGEWIKVAG